jgi:hypothetical protein
VEKRENSCWCGSWGSVFYLKCLFNVLENGVVYICVIYLEILVGYFLYIVVL